MSGAPAGSRRHLHGVDRCPGRALLDARDYQWNEAVPFWKDIQARAADADVKVCIEMHPHNLVYNPGTMERLADEIGATHVGAEMDPSHLFWQGIDPVVAAKDLGGLVYNAAAKDTRINEAAKVNGVLDDRFGRVAEGDPGALPLGGGTPCAAGREPLLGLRRRRPRPRRRVLDRVPAGAARDRPRHGGQHRARGPGAGPAGGPDLRRQHAARGREGAVTGYRRSAQWLRRHVVRRDDVDLRRRRLDGPVECAVGPHDDVAGPQHVVTQVVLQNGGEPAGVKERQVVARPARSSMSTSATRWLNGMSVDPYWWDDGPHRAESDRIRQSLLIAAEVLGARHIKVTPDGDDAPWDPEHWAKKFAELAAQAARRRHAAGDRVLPVVERQDAARRPAARRGRRARRRRRGHRRVAHRARPHTGGRPRVRPAAPDHRSGAQRRRPEVVGTLFEDTVHRRRYCGEGTFDLTGIIAALRTAGWTGPWGVEILSEEHRSLPVREALGRAAESARNILGPSQT